MDYNYPELYYRVFPKVIDTLNEFLGNNNNSKEISKEDIEEMIGEVYIKIVRECPEIDVDPGERRGRGTRYRLQRPFYGRRKLLIDIITIILLSELLRVNKTYGYGLEKYSQIF